MEGIPDEKIYHHHRHQKPDSSQFVSRKYIHTVFYDCIEVGKDVSPGVSDQYKGRVVFSERRNERSIGTYSRRNDNNRDDKAVVSKKIDTPHGVDRKSISRDANLSSYTNTKVCMVSFYKVIKTSHGVRFKSRMTSTNMFAKGQLSKRTFIGLKPGDKVNDNNEHGILNSANDDLVVSKSYNNKTQNADFRNELSEKLSMKRFCVRFNSKSISVEGTKNTTPNTNDNKAKSKITGGFSPKDQEMQNVNTKCRTNKNYRSSKDGQVNRDPPSLKKQKLCKQLKNNGTRDKQTRQYNNKCKEVTGKTLITNVFTENYHHRDACKDCAEIHRAILDNNDRTTCVATKHAATMLGRSDILEKIGHTTTVATKNPAITFERYPMLGNNDTDTHVARKNATMLLEGSDNHRLPRQNATMPFEGSDNHGLPRKNQIANTRFDNRTSRDSFFFKGIKKVCSYLGIDSLMSFDFGRKESKRKGGKGAHVTNYTRVDPRLGLLISWNLLQLVFLVVTFLWALLCNCSFKKYVLEPGKCVRYDVRRPNFGK